jgi:hypothetical protein
LNDDGGGLDENEDIVMENKSNIQIIDEDEADNDHINLLPISQNKNRSAVEKKNVISLDYGEDYDGTSSFLLNRKRNPSPNRNNINFNSLPLSNKKPAMVTDQNALKQKELYTKYTLSKDNISSSSSISDNYNQSSSAKINNLYHDMDAEFDNKNNSTEYDNKELDTHNYENINEDDISIGGDDVLKNKIDQIKQLREKKRIIDHKQETYDQDYIEVKNTNSKDLIKDVYSFIDKHDAIEDDGELSENEKELLQWEMNKLRTGISAGWGSKAKSQRMKETDQEDISEMFRRANVKSQNIDINKILNDVNEDILVNEVQIDTYKEKANKCYTEVASNKITREKCINKIDHYVNQFKFLQKIYFQVLKFSKSKKKYKIIKFILI